MIMIFAHYKAKNSASATFLLTAMRAVPSVSGSESSRFPHQHHYHCPLGRRDCHDSHAQDHERSFLIETMNQFRKAEQQPGYSRFVLEANDMAQVHVRVIPGTEDPAQQDALHLALNMLPSQLRALLERSPQTSELFIRVHLPGVRETLDRGHYYRSQESDYAVDGDRVRGENIKASFMAAQKEGGHDTANEVRMAIEHWMQKCMEEMSKVEA